ncbi:hypothetical protein [Emcibacter sp.]|uniref:hypothetical protein n=1 Tax=Emcibacter sp. TaxID=1979954 RepID=UPI003A8F13A7
MTEETYAQFLDMLNEANSIVAKYYPGAEFYEADLNIELVGSPWRFVFNIPPAGSHASNTTAILTNYMGNFQMPPRHYDAPWLEDVVIPLPIKLDLAAAVQLAKDAGYDGNISYITLRWPLYPGVNEPSYIFNMPSMNTRVFVGVYSKKVSPYDGARQ